MLLAVIFKENRTMAAAADHENERSRCVFPRQVKRRLNGELRCKHTWKRGTLSNLTAGLIGRRMRPERQRADHKSFPIHWVGHALYLYLQQRERSTANHQIGKTLYDVKTRFSDETQAVQMDDKVHLEVESAGQVRNG